MSPGAGGAGGGPLPGGGCTLAVLTVPGRVDRVEADGARVRRLARAGTLGAVVRPAPACRWWADEDHAAPDAPGSPDAPGAPGAPGGEGDAGAGGLAWSGRFPRGRRRRRLAEAVRAASGRPVTAVYAPGFAAWAEAVALAERLDAGVLLGAREQAAVGAARRLVRSMNPTRCVIVAETEPLADRLREATDNLLVVEAVPPGVPERDPPEPPSETPVGGPLLAAVPLDAGAAGLGALLAGLGSALADRPGAEAQLLLLGEAPALAAAHRIAAATGSLGCVSAAPAGPGCGGGPGVPLPEVLDGVHALARPRVCPAEEPPVGLEAAARGLPVLAPRPPRSAEDAVEASPSVARELPRADAEAWAEGFGWLLDAPAEARAAGDAARARVRARCPVDASDAALLHLAGLVAPRG